MTYGGFIWFCIGLSAGALLQWLNFKLNGMLRSMEEWYRAHENNE